LFIAEAPNVEEDIFLIAISVPYMNCSFNCISAMGIIFVGISEKQENQMVMDPAFAGMTRL
jgi:hypothetical protein